MTTPTPPRFRLTAAERARFRVRLDDLRIANRRAADAAALWRRRNAELTDLAQRSGWDDLRTAETKAINLGLRDAAGKHAFWTLETQRLSALLCGELAARELLGGEDFAAGVAGMPAPARAVPTMAKVG